jgi:hypothetical protein
MHFEIVHTFDAEPDAVARAMFSPEVAEFLSKNVPSVEGIEPISRDEDERQIRRKVKYRPVPVIRKVATKEVKPEWMHWVEESIYDKKSRVVTFANIPTTRKIAELMENRGTITLEPAGPGRTRRIIKGELKIKVFMLGAVAERLIYPQAQKIVNEEAQALTRLLSQKREG